MLEESDEATYSLEYFENREGSEVKRSLRTRDSCSLSYSCWSFFQEGYSGDSSYQNGWMVSDKHVPDASLPDMVVRGWKAGR